MHGIRLKKIFSLLLAGLTVGAVSVPAMAQLPNTGDNQLLFPIMGGLLLISVILIVVYVVLSKKKK